MNISINISVSVNNNPVNVLSSIKKAYNFDYKYAINDYIDNKKLSLKKWFNNKLDNLRFELDKPIKEEVVVAPIVLHSLSAKSVVYNASTLLVTADELTNEELAYLLSEPTIEEDMIVPTTQLFVDIFIEKYFKNYSKRTIRLSFVAGLAAVPLNEVHTKYDSMITNRKSVRYADQLTVSNSNALVILRELLTTPQALNRAASKYVEMAKASSETFDDSKYHIAVPKFAIAC